MKRVFKIGILTCERCGGAVKMTASIEDSVVIKKILNHLARRAEAADARVQTLRAGAAAT